MAVATAPASATGRRRRRAPVPGPARTCVACRRTQSQADLRRITRTPDGDVAVDQGRRRAPGRGAYLCTDAACWRPALATPAVLSRAFRGHVPQPLCTALAAQFERAEPRAVDTDLTHTEDANHSAAEPPPEPRAAAAAAQHDRDAAATPREEPTP